MTNEQADWNLISIKDVHSVLHNHMFDNAHRPTIYAELKRISKELDGLSVVIPSADKWIPVSERLPEDAEHVLVYYERNAWKDGEQFRKRDIDKGWQIEGWWHVDGCNGVVGIAWMPLPSPYKGEQL